MKRTYPYRPSKAFSIGYTILIVIGVLLTIGRWRSVFDSDFVMISPAFHYHISNLSLSLILYLIIGYSWLLSGVRFRNIAMLGVIIVADNFACETLMGFMNTADIVDALYGTIGTAIAFMFLLATNKCGLIPTDCKKP